MKEIKYVKMLPWSRPKNWYNNIDSLFLNYRYRKQRKKYGVSKFDTFNFDGYLLDIFKNGLSSIKEDSLSSPWQLTQEEWCNVLDRMIELCEIMTKYYECDYEDYESYFEKYSEAKIEFFELMIEYFDDLWS